MKIATLTIFAVVFLAVGSASGQSTGSQKKSAQGQETTLMAELKKLKTLEPEQLKTFESWRKEVTTQQAKLQKSAEITPELARKRREAFQKIGGQRNADQRNQLANEKAGFNSDQIKAQQKITAGYRNYRLRVMKQLNDEQRQTLPKWIQQEYLRAKEQAEKAKAGTGDTSGKTQESRRLP